MAVVVPVHDEEEHLARCLVSIRRALAEPGVRDRPTVVVVVLDHCGDESPAIARALARRDDVVVAVEARNVGVARATGAAVALRWMAARGVAPAEVWLANTDADSRVPRDWLARQLRYGASADAVAGVVRVDSWVGHPLAARWRFSRTYWSGPVRPPVGSHPHVHGANFGVRGDAYLEAGGFPPLACSEDHGLWDALRANGRPVRSTRRLWVATSGRPHGRAPDGFAADLRLAARPAGLAAGPAGLAG